MKKHFNHIFLRNHATNNEYKFPRNVVITKNLPKRERNAHSQNLSSQIASAETKIQSMSDKLDPSFKPETYVLQFKSEDNCHLAIDSLDTPANGLEVLNSTEIIDAHGEKLTQATVRLKDKSSLEKLKKKITLYGTEDSKFGKPKHKGLVESISKIEASDIYSYWTDDQEHFPQSEESIWWEVWLLKEDATKVKFECICRNVLNIEISDYTINFHDRIIVLIKATTQTLESLIKYCHEIAEIRAPSNIVNFFHPQSSYAKEQLEDLSQLVTYQVPPTSYITLLDTGVNAHPNLLDKAINENDMHVINPDWGKRDLLGHGTKMSGTVLLGDLTKYLNNTSQVTVSHAIESVKLLNRDLGEYGDYDPELYGAVTCLAFDAVHKNTPHRNRTFCLAITAKGKGERGRPSSWSAAIDDICFGTETGKKHLFLISSGNMDEPGINYPDNNMIESLHDPAQSWNALTVGAYTEKHEILSDGHSHDWHPIAPKGGLCPSSTTSLVWGSWPIKPEVVFEGGNMAINSSGDIDFKPGLSTLTTSHILDAPIACFGDTSAAVAEAARFTAQIKSQYPEIWPETVRALTVHSAEWTTHMLEPINGALVGAPKNKLREIIRTHGYGVPNLNKALYSAQDLLTLVTEQDFSPYYFSDEKQSTLARRINYHSLPWPKDILSDLDASEIRMRITLSYFIEPSPAKRGKDAKHKYQSFGLRFSVKPPSVSDADFKKQINKAERLDGNNEINGITDSEHWTIGEQKWSGSIHSDIWIGTPAQLAECDQIAVYPVQGWWHDKYKKLDHANRTVRYSLIISIETDEAQVDLYTPVYQMLQVPVTT